MKKYSSTTIISSKNELYKLEKFVDGLCRYHNVGNEYFGNIALAADEAAEILFSVCSGERGTKLKISLEKTRRGILLNFYIDGLKAIDNEDDSLELAIQQKKLEREVCILKSIADETFINHDRLGIGLLFEINGINMERAISRVDYLKGFWAGNERVIQGG